MWSHHASQNVSSSHAYAKRKWMGASERTSELTHAHSQPDKIDLIRYFCIKLKTANALCTMLICMAILIWCLCSVRCVFSVHSIWSQLWLLWLLLLTLLSGCNAHIMLIYTLYFTNTNDRCPWPTGTFIFRKTEKKKEENTHIYICI